MILQGSNKFRVIPRKFPRYSAVGFTLLELILYIGILSITSLMGVSTFISISRSYQRNRAMDEVTQNLRIASQIIRQQISQATNVITAYGSDLVLSHIDPSIDTTTFSLSNGAITLKFGSGAANAITSDRVTVDSLSFSLISVPQSEFDPFDHWAWSGGATTTTSTAEGVGWIDLNPALGSVRVPVGVAGDLFGYAYIPADGSYISLNCITTDSCSSVQYKVSASATGTLSGWAWSDQYGWISFNSSDTNSTVPYSVKISSVTGEFSGWAWSENIGWISFNCANPEVNSCASVPYKVKAIKKLGRPAVGVLVNMTISYKSGGRAILSYSDSASFAVALDRPSAVTISSISPAVASGTVENIAVSGSGFKSGAIVKLSRPGFSDIDPLTTFSVSGGTSIVNTATPTFDLSGREKGFWDVVVINPDGQVGIKPRGFEIQ